MGWQYISEISGVKYYSVSEEVKILVERLIQFFFNVSPGFYAVIIMMTVAVFIIYLVAYITQSIKQTGI